MTADPRWPADIPQAPTHSGYTESRQSNSASFRPQTGAPITRRLGTYRSSRVELTFQMKDDQVSSFERFFEDELLEGNLPYRWTHPRKQSDARWKIDLPENGDRAFTISKLERATGYWLVSFAVFELPG